MDIRAIIEAKISAAGLSKKEVAERMGIFPTNLNGMITKPSWPTLESLANALNMSVAELVADSEPVPQTDHTAHNVIIDGVKYEPVKEDAESEK